MATLSPVDAAPTLTQSLLQSSSSSFTRATRAPFLAAAGKGLISRETLSQWLSQDRLYGQAYISFIGSLLAHLRLPTEHDPKRSKLQWRIAEMLTAAMENILREQKFYDDVAQRYALKLDEPPPEQTIFKASRVTQIYVELFRSFLDPSKTLLEGMVVLWATEKCYLEAWSYALEESTEGDGEKDLDGGALRTEFIPNWSRKEFVDFVERIAGLLNELWVNGSGDKEAAQRAWEEVLLLEEKFWPDVKTCG
jgi:thiaminase